MAPNSTTSTSQNTSRTFSIPNKLHRRAHNTRLKSALETQKRKDRFERKKAEAKDPSLKTKRLRENIPDTLERKRVWDERVPGAVPVDKKQKVDDASEDNDADAALKALEEGKQEEAAEDEERMGLFPTLEMPPPSSHPRVLVTTNRNCHVHEVAEELANLFPNGEYIRRDPPGAERGRRPFSIKEICKFAGKPTTVDPATGKKRDPFTHVVVVNEDHKVPNAMTIVALPDGPTFHFSVTHYTPAKMVSGHGKPTSHIPELILNNFLTPLGKTTASLFQGIFPRVPEFQGRQVVTLHNQRDYIFFRRHRYVFREKRESEKEAGFGLADDKAPGGLSQGEKGLGVRVGLQELGPSFTLKLRRVERGVKEEVVWVWKAVMEKDRKKFQL